MKHQTPHTKDPTLFGEESLLGQKDSPVSSRRHSPVQAKTYSFHQSQHRSKERPSLSSSEAAPSSKALDKPCRLTEKELAEAVRKWAAKKSDKSEESDLSGISEFKVVPKHHYSLSNQRSQRQMQLTAQKYVKIVQQSLQINSIESQRN